MSFTVKITADLFIFWLQACKVLQHFLIEILVIQLRGNVNHTLLHISFHLSMHNCTQLERMKMQDLAKRRQHTHTHTRLTALFRGLHGWAGTRKVKPIWILLKQETVSGSGISWAICNSAPSSRQIKTPAHHHSVFYRPDALPAAQPTASKH